MRLPLRHVLRLLLRATSAQAEAQLPQPFSGRGGELSREGSSAAGPLVPPMAPSPARTPCFFDGACARNQFGNKGRMRIAYVVDGARVVREVEDLDTPNGPIRSNNIAEYKALILLLNHLRERQEGRGTRKGYLVCGDSQLVIRQMLGEYRVTKSHLRPLHLEAKKVAAELDVEFRWVPRERNLAGHLLEARHPRDHEATREN